MFKFLKKKIKDAVHSFSKSAKEEEVDESELTQEQAQALEQEQQQAQEVEVVEETLVEEQEPEPIPEPEVEKAQEPPVEEPSSPERSTLSPDVKPEEELEKASAEESISESVHAELEESSVEDQKEVEKEEAEEFPEPDVLDQLEKLPEASEAVDDTLSSQIPDESPTAPEQKKKSFLSKIFGKKKDEDFELLEKEEAKDSEVAQEPEEKKTIPVPEPSEELPSEEPVEEVQAEPEKPSEEVEEKKKEVIKEPVAIAEKKEAVHKELLEEDIKDTTKKKKGFFGRLRDKVVRFQLTDEKFEELFWDFELAMLENNVAVEVIEKIKKDLKENLTKENVSRRSIEDIMLSTLKDSLDDILSVPSFDFIDKVKSKKPYVVCVIGVNGSGKTTTIGKIIHLFQQNKLSVVVAAADTFRAAAIHQLEEHTNKLGVKLIKHDYNADPSAVAFDAIKHAKAKGIDVVLIDTAGRLQSNSNLMDELKKLVRVNKPDLNLFVGESITGNDCVEQAVAFDEAVGIDAIVLSKADVDDKGGAAISISYVSKKPILFLGTGQTYDDLTPYKKELILDALGL